jgi:F0F1-type ATP synthase assembly protein I
MIEIVPRTDNEPALFSYFPGASEFGGLAVIVPITLVALAIWLAVRIANRREPLAPEFLRKLLAAVLVVAVPWWLLAVFISLTWAWLLSEFNDMDLSVVKGLWQS